MMLAAALILGELAVNTSDRPTLAVVWGGVALAAYAVGLLFLLRLGQDEGLGLARWKIGPWMLLWYGLVFGITTVTWSQPQYGTASEIDVSSVPRALWLVAVAITAWSLGYRVGPGRLACDLAARTLGRLRRRFGVDVRGPATPWILYAIGAVARLVTTVTTGRFGYVGDASSAVSTATGFGGILGALTLCAPLGLAAAALQVFRERLPCARTTLVVLFLVELAFGAAAGGKESSVIAVLAVVIPFSAARLRLPKAVLIAAVLAFLVVVIPFNQAYRSVARVGTVTLTPGQAIAAAPSIAATTFTAHGPLTVIPDSVDYMAQRIREIDSPALIMQRTPGQLGFRNPAQLILVPAAGMVPRALWPGKPIVVTGYQFSQEFLELPSTVYTATADTMVGGFFWYGGWIIVIVGMFVFGAALRLLDDVIDVSVNPQSIFLVLLLFPSLVGGEEDWSSILAAVPTTILVWLFAVALTFRIHHSAAK
ncbi:MAG: hypothetical protein ACLPKE_32755 [Streptosporangiaceae bacterium]